MTLIGLLFLAVFLAWTRKNVLAYAVAALAIVNLLFAKSFEKVLGKLGANFFQEAADFDLGEAIFYLKTVVENLEPDLDTVTLLKCAAVVVLFVALALFGRRLPIQTPLRSSVLAVSALVLTGWGIYDFGNSKFREYRDAANAYEVVSRNFSTLAVPEVQLAQTEPVTLFLYIGEATAAMNMNLYGYPRNTTPNLTSMAASDPNLIVFDNVFSTHTHTSPSLLEALSFRPAEQSNRVPVNEQLRTSLVDMITGSGIRTVLYSNQGKTGTWNQAASILFKSAERNFSIDSPLGDLESSEKPFDHEFLEQALQDRAFREASPSVVVFHSYAGHGPYRKNIPEGIATPEWFVGGLMPEGLSGDIKAAKTVDEYDAAVSYIDSNLAAAIRFTQAASKPAVFVYFSDHGESPYTRRAHDSSRFIMEMARIPFLVYFNDRAREVMPEKYARLKELAASRQTATLAQFPATALYLLGASIAGGEQFYQPPLMGSKWSPDPILVRRIDGDVQYIDLEGSQESIVTTDDVAMRTYMLSNMMADRGPALCYHRSNTLGTALRGALASPCIEFDIVAGQDIEITHPPKPATGFDLDDMLKNSQLSTKLLWLDSKNLDTSAACERLLTAIKPMRGRFRSAIVEFPSGTPVSGGLADCAGQFRALGLATSHYVSTDTAKACAKQHAGNGSAESQESCNKLKSELDAAHASGIYSDISFDVRALPAIRALDVSRNFRWNTWNVDSQDYRDFLSSLGPDAERFRAVILNNEDPNRR